MVPKCSIGFPLPYSRCSNGVFMHDVELFWILLIYSYKGNTVCIWEKAPLISDGTSFSFRGNQRGQEKLEKMSTSMKSMLKLIFPYFLIFFSTGFLLILVKNVQSLQHIGILNDLIKKFEVNIFYSIADLTVVENIILFKFNFFCHLLNFLISPT